MCIQFSCENKTNDHCIGVDCGQNEFGHSYILIISLFFSFLPRFLNVAVCLQSYRRKPEDFSFISSLGHGAFGRVQLVREITTGRVCAMKVLKKSRMLAQHTDYWAEKEIMSHGESPWIVQLYYAYQVIYNYFYLYATFNSDIYFDNDKKQFKLHTGTDYIG
ncbi:uncharacterized protein DC041_0011460 [Schistosoma bovis]|uniref:Protein kinase domain-containing protein n=1 Tax=Schistosoma bovis TaxID=6184 RepID=A0A430QKQ4_SCHBO|nr:uncharacterized protein DC041_0005845 [Schistosoma bovis]RTG90754.1 uncharacterized protein DC041_0011460 [Schistosoma bovis]